MVRAEPRGTQMLSYEGPEGTRHVAFGVAVCSIQHRAAIGLSRDVGRSLDLMVERLAYITHLGAHENQVPVTDPRGTPDSGNSLSSGGASECAFKQIFWVALKLENSWSYFPIHRQLL